MRYLLYLTEGDPGQEVQYLIDRKNDYWFVPPETLHLPIPGHEVGFHQKTILDGELVIDKDPNGKLQPRFMVFDCIVIDGNNLMQRSLDKRVAYYIDQIQKPYKQLLAKFPEEIAYQHFLVAMKDFKNAYHVENMFDHILKALPHGNDGLIFTCRGSPYKHGTDHHILKWKPENENSIDLRLSLDFPVVQPDAVDISRGITKPYYDYDAIPVCNLLVYVGNNAEDKYFSTLYMDAQLWDKLKSLGEPLNDRIVECYMDEQRRWRYMRFRDDKTNANHETTVESVLESIQDRITEQDLRDYAPRIKAEWKKREAAPKRAEAAVPSNQLKRKAEEQGDRRPSPNPPGVGPR